MGSNSSSSEKHKVEEREVNKRTYDEWRILEEQRATWRAAQEEVAKHHREQKLLEDEKYRRSREEWLRQENLREQQQQQQLLHEQQRRSQELLNQKQHWEQWRVQQEQLVKKNAPPAPPKEAPLTSVQKPSGSALPVNSRISNQSKSNPLFASPIKQSVSPRQPAHMPISVPKVPVALQSTKAQPMAFHNAEVSEVSKVSPPESVPKASASNKTQKKRCRNTAKKTSSKLPSNCDKSLELYHQRFASPKFPFAKWTDVDYIQEIHGMSQYVAENITALFESQFTISFIARYRKHTTLGMEVDQLRGIRNTSEQAKLLKQKVLNLIVEIDKQGSCNAELYALLCSTKSLNDLALIESVFESLKPEIVKAKEIGLNVSADAIVKGQHCVPLNHYQGKNPDVFKSAQQLKSVMICLVADMICKEPKMFRIIQMLCQLHPLSIETKKRENTDNVKTNSKNKTDYQNYYNFSSFEKNIKPHQVMEINHGENQKLINVKVIIPNQFEKDFKEACEKQYADACNTSDLHKSILTAAFDFAWRSTIKPNIFKLKRQELTQRAEMSLIADIAKNAKQLLLIPPIRGQVIVGIKPGIQGGCKLAVISEEGEVLETETIHPHDVRNPRAKSEAERILSGIILVHKCSTLALGDGAVSRDTETFLTELINKTALQHLNIRYTIVDETPASYYASSEEAVTEFPYLDANFRAAISLARRLRDPIAELIKIDPRQWNVKISQHNLPGKQLNLQLNAAIEEAVSFVGVDINTASLSLLKRVAGLDETKAKSLIKWRESSGPFRTRNDLKKVEHICNKTFEQCAGFVKIIPETAVQGTRRMGLDPLNYLDQTCIHPEMYDVAEAFLRAANCDLIQLGTKAFIFSVKLFAKKGYTALANEFHTTVETIKLIVDGLSSEKGFDVRGKTDRSLFRNRLKRMEDLVVGTLLTGVVRSNAHFGSFVDVGLEIDGLIHNTKMAGVTLDIGQQVETKVLSVNIERRRLGLGFVRCA
ncbi:S1 RNA-binding domain-containing protein 1-like [Venturia canescens]|uniref:S1 RNA-binding domain-containing protein 1-like n=1 Tax=Venturia canescens TaxID=32260 RepID=UPI001C9CF53F|nr:S1 RNA-binding domain-containing protein 1-like [Venturia canescens]